jgi:gas vesicle protein
MSDLAYQRFMASYMLTTEEQLPENRQEIIDYTEDVLQAKGIECDKRIAELSEEQVKEILEEVRKLREKGKKNKKKLQQQQEDTSAERQEQKDEEEEIAVSSSS